MAKLDPTVKKEIAYVAVWTGALSVLMEAVFLMLGKWTPMVLLGNLAGALTALGNYLALSLTVLRILGSGEAKDRAILHMRRSMTVRMLAMALICALWIGLVKTDPIATLLPLLFPRIGLTFRPMIDRRRGKESPDPEGSDMLD